MTPRDAYAKLVERFALLDSVEGAYAVLDWDRAAKMPEGGREARARQMQALQMLGLKMLGDPEVRQWLETAGKGAASLKPEEQANLREMKHQMIHKIGAGPDLLMQYVGTISVLEGKWREARSKNDFGIVAPHLQNLFDIGRKIGQAKGKILGCSPYEAWLDFFTPGLRMSTVKPSFDALEQWLPGFIKRVQAKQGKEQVYQHRGPIAQKRQEKLGRDMLTMIGFDWKHGRLDTSLHPFQGGTPDDVRITTRYDEHNALTTMMHTIHEGGHALYVQGLPKRWRATPLGNVRDPLINESQAMVIEMQAARRPEFWQGANAKIKQALGVKGRAWTPTNLQRLATRVQPSLIRTDADPITYLAHVILRQKLEKQMLEGSLKVADLPAAWKKGMKDMLGVDVKDDNTGPLQDFHWYNGGIGYFPNYALGAIASAQFFEAAVAADPKIKPAMSKGDFKPLLGWLRTNVHDKGSLMEFNQLIQSATGKPLDVEVFKDSMEKLYIGTPPAPKKSKKPCPLRKRKHKHKPGLKADRARVLPKL
ncbi:MAG: carboxypeptidase M32 [Alphaproteobacteria bacterium]